MVSVKEASTGDCIYALLACQNTPVFCEITKILDGERAFEVTTSTWGQRIVTETNAYWEEKQAKRSKIVKVQNNYSEWAKEYFNEETETDSRIDPIHHGQPEKCENKGEACRDENISGSSKRKQKSIRKSTKRKRPTTRNRKISRKKK